MASEIEKLEALAAKATERPWQQQHTWSTDGLCTIIGALDGDPASPTYAHICDIDEANDDYLANAALIVALVNDGLPLLRKLQAENERLRAGVLNACGWIVHWRRDVEGNLKPTPESLATAYAEIRAALGDQQ